MTDHSRESHAPSMRGSIKVLLAGVLGLAGGVGATLAWVGSRPPEPLAAKSSTPEIHEIPLRRAHAPAPDAPLPMGSVPSIEPRELAAARMSRYEDRFREDRLDPVWAPGAERSLVEAATDPSLTALGVPTDFNARCLGRMCKITMMFETQGQASDWSELYVLGTAGAISLAQQMVVPRSDGRAELVFYGARKGSEFLLAEPVALMGPKGKTAAPASAR